MHTGTRTHTGSARCKGRWERLICLWKDLILSFHYGNVTKSFSIARHSVRRLLCQPISGSPWATIPLCVLARVCLRMLTNARQRAQPCVDVFLCVLLYTQSQQNFLISLMPISVSLVLYVFMKSPPDGNQLPSWLTGKQLQPTLHYSPLAPASPLRSPRLIFSISHTLPLPFSPRSPGCWQAILSEPKFKTQLCLGTPMGIADVLRKASSQWLMEPRKNVLAG